MLFREYRTAAAIWLLEPLDAIKKTIPCWLVYIHIYTYIFIHFYIYSVSYSSSHTEVAKGSAVSGIGMFSGFTARARDAKGECGSHSFLQFFASCARGTMGHAEGGGGVGGWVIVSDSGNISHDRMYAVSTLARACVF